MKCTRCNGGGFLRTKNGSKRCPFCNPAHMETQQLTHEGVDWLCWFIVTLVLGDLVAGSVAGHYFVSLGVIQ